MNVVLADMPQKERDYNLTYPSLSITYLIGYAREYFGQDKHSFHYLEGNCSLKEHLATLEKLKPHVYGTTITAPVSELAYATICAVHEKFPNVKIICGGPHATAAPEHVLEHAPVDVCVIGEGEVTFVELLEHFQGTGKPLKEIDGIAYRDENGQVVRTPKRAFIRDIDTIPFPAWDLVKNFNAYPGMHFRKAYPQSYILCSRGCPFDCNFCSNPVWKDNKPWLRLRSPEKIAEEVQWLYELGVREIYLGADEFNIKIDWAEEVCNRIAALGHQDDLFFHINARADKLTPQLAKKMASINIWLAHLGIETGNQRTLDGIGKRITIEQVVEACRMMKAAGIKIFGYLMLFHAWEDEDGHLCYETSEDVNNTIRFASKLFKEKLLSYSSWQIATPMPGSRLWDLALRHNLTVDAETFRGIRRMTMKLPGITSRDVRRAIQKGVLLKTYYALRSGNINWRELWRRGKESFKNIIGIGNRGEIK